MDTCKPEQKYLCTDAFRGFPRAILSLFHNLCKRCQSSILKVSEPYNQSKRRLRAARTARPAVLMAAVYKKPLWVIFWFRLVF